jgi:predicted RNA-binding Zn-ribbon protein involved in translation (DUF1610 family)
MWCGSGSWSGWWHGGWSLLVLFGLVALAGWVVFRSARQDGIRNRAQTVCSACGGEVQDPYFRCPHCGNVLKSHCPACSRVVETTWKFCPYCSETVTGRTAANPQPQEGDVP